MVIREKILLTMSRSLARFLNSYHLFPVIILLLIIVFSSLKLHGSSIGIYNEILYGADYQDKDLIAGKPRAIRSDEWAATTPLTISQYRNNYAVVNPDIGNGVNVSIATNIPSNDWVTLFRPQNILFLITPFDFAFAFKWWFLPGLLAVSVYYLALRFLPGKRLISSLIALLAVLNPFSHWWYNEISFLPIAYGALILLSFVGVFKATKRKEFLWWALLLFYALASFGLVIYPPFQIPVAIVVAVVAMSYLVATVVRRQNKRIGEILRSVGWVVLAISISAVILAAFYYSRADVISALTSTEYPAARYSVSGDYGLKEFISMLATPFQYRLQLPSAGGLYHSNQSESASFIYFGIFLIIPALFLLYKDKIYRRPFDYLLIGSLAAMVVFFLRYFVPPSTSYLDWLLLDKVPTYRLVIGFGVAQLLLMLAVVRKVLAGEINLEDHAERFVAILSAALSFLLVLLAGLNIAGAYPGFISEPWQIFTVSVVVGIVVYFSLNKGYLVYGLIVAVLFSGFSTLAINPLYRSLDVLTDSDLSRAIAKIGSSDSSGRWTVVDNITFNHYPLQAGVRTINGSSPYPQTDLWKKIDDSEAAKFVYNRGAHVITKIISTSEHTHLELVRLNIFSLNINPCEKYDEEIDLRYLLSLNDIQHKCLKLLDKVVYPSVSFYIYKFN